MKCKWISIKDKKPIKRKKVFITNEKDRWVSIGFLDGNNKWLNECDKDCEPTHWAILPEPYKQIQLK